MSDPIKVGDLVVVVRTCCAQTAAQSLGLIGTVQRAAKTGWACRACGATNPSESRVVAFPGSWDCAPVSWLRKIPPFPELADEKHDDHIPELVLK